jgi:hypothetical protein
LLEGLVEGEEDPDIIATAVTDNAIIESAAQDEVDSAGEVVDADDTPDLGVEDADSCMDGEDSAEAYLDWDIYGRSQENILIHTTSVNDIVRQKDYGKLKQKVDEWMEDTGCTPCTKEEFQKWYDTEVGNNKSVKGLFNSAFSFNVIDGQSYIMVQSMVSYRAAVATIGTILAGGAGAILFLISLIKHAVRGEYVGNMFAVGKDKNGSCKIMNKALFCVTKDNRSFRKDAVGSAIV